MGEQVSAERDELVRILNEYDPEGGVTDPDDMGFWERQADAIIAAGWGPRSGQA